MWWTGIGRCAPAPTSLCLHWTAQSNSSMFLLRWYHQNTCLSFLYSFRMTKCHHWTHFGYRENIAGASIWERMECALYPAVLGESGSTKSGRLILRGRFREITPQKQPLKHFSQESDADALFMRLRCNLPLVLLPKSRQQCRHH